MGQGGQVLRREGGLIQQHSIISRFAYRGALNSANPQRLFRALANLGGRSDQNLSALVPEMYIAVPGNQLKRIRLRRLHQDNSRWARRSAHSQRRYGTSRFNLGQRWPSRLVATAALRQDWRLHRYTTGSRSVT